MPARIHHPFCGRLAVAAVAVVAATCVGPIAAAAADPAITYRTFFQDPGTGPTADYSLEEHAIDLIDATPSGESLTFTLRDFNRMPVADALIAAHNRGVEVDGVVDGGERDQPAVIALQAALGP